MSFLQFRIFEDRLDDEVRVAKFVVIGDAADPAATRRRFFLAQLCRA